MIGLAIIFLQVFIPDASEIHDQIVFGYVRHLS